MANCAKYIVAIVAVIVGVICGEAFNSDDTGRYRNVLGLHLPYEYRVLDSELQLARMLLVTPRIYHIKRNTELINSLLSLPKNINNTGK